MSDGSRRPEQIEFEDQGAGIAWKDEIPAPPKGQWEHPKRWSQVDARTVKRWGKARPPGFRQAESTAGTPLWVPARSILARWPDCWKKVLYVNAPYGGQERSAVLAPGVSVPVTSMEALLIGAFQDFDAAREATWQERARRDADALGDHPQNCLEDRLNESAMGRHADE